MFQLFSGRYDKKEKILVSMTFYYQSLTCSYFLKLLTNPESSVAGITPDDDKVKMSNNIMKINIELSIVNV